ncbi:MAG: 16S rRNA (uracil(1498)-N(3))-methyltransferase [Clostridium sp.]|nr:16S rRNA (uracil(1498)-N(3))-methyltransferase [Clostridium sp.]MCM1207551.1 16S rRNA (uracil(1498)-N(3))-methyltransferase [Ruminococcus sp.]
MHRFYVENFSGTGNTIDITGSDVNHIKNVLRLKTGDEIIVGDGSGTDYTCKIEGMEQDRVTTVICDVTRNAAELETKIILFQGMPKSDKLELIIQKTVELGVSEIVPVITKRTVVKPQKNKEEKKLERYNAIAASAAKQSGRGVIPRVMPFMSFQEALSYAKGLDMCIIPYENAKGMEYARSVIRDIKGKKSLGIFIGPEGGLADEEVDAAVSMGAKSISLGGRILRTETAGLAALSIIMFEIDG